ncbi:MAG TPA: hypothetical protein PLX89_12360, partial [Verrucomicrobiota bacterium]|nr:hypothetical protein [Verrucomicrobiota bacterium]
STHSLGSGGGNALKTPQCLRERDLHTGKPARSCGQVTLKSKHQRHGRAEPNSLPRLSPGLFNHRCSCWLRCAPQQYTLYC